MSRRSVMAALIQDLRYACRSFLKIPGFTLAAVLSLAIGIGANSSVFSVVNALLMHALPYKDADRLVILWNRSPGLNITQDWFSTAQYFDIRNGQRSFADVAIAIGGVETLTGGGEPERIGAIHVSSNLLSMLGARAEYGRVFTAEEDRPGAAPIALLGHGTWMRRFGGDAKAIGKQVAINGKAYQIAGVMPSAFSLPREVMPTLNGAEDAEVLLPLPLAADAASARNHEDYNLMARLKPGATVQQAQAELDTLTARLRHDFPDLYPPNGGLTFGVVPLQEQVVGDVRRILMIMLAAVGCVLLIACANVANLLLSRALSRSREISIRAALGASRSRLIRQLLTESVLLAVCGAALGVGLALVGNRVIHLLGTKLVPRLHDIAINGEVLTFTLILAVACGVLFGLAPALRLAGGNVQQNLQDGTRGSSAGSTVWGGNNLRRLLVIAELALSVVLLISAGLLIRSFVRLQNVFPGFNPRDLLTVELKMSGRRYEGDGSEVREAYRRLWERLEQLPGVTASGGITSLPLSEMYAWGPIIVEGRPLPGETFLNADQRVAGGDYFQAMQIPLISGRFFNQQDTPDKPRVAIVDEAMARQLWPDQNPLGKRIKPAGVDAKGPWMTVVGVVGRIKQDTLDSDPRIALYLSHTQYPARTMNLVVRSSVAPQALMAEVRGVIHELDPDLPLYNVRTMGQRVDDSMARRRFTMLVLGIFAAVALALATTGIYGVIAYLVSQGTREIGIRLALGATRMNILRLIIRQALSLALAGVVLGVAGAFLFARAVRSLLYGVSATDAVTFSAVPTLLVVVAIAACYVPARRAAQVDPMISLRCE
ncbi:MAG TPA: ABC transporter permease [Candidatus Angelobacter sp.]|nr:ABC transporter permease [Candidatus Angelobacter sp.]